MENALTTLLLEVIDLKTMVELSVDDFGMLYVDHLRKVQRRGWVVVDRFLSNNYGFAHQHYIDLCNKLGDC